VGQGGTRRQAADRITRSAIPFRLRLLRNIRIRERHERQTDAVLLQPGDPAFTHDRRVLCHYQAKVLRDEGRIFDVDRRAFARDISHHAMHHRTARRNIGRLFDLRSRIFSLLFHPAPSGYRSNCKSSGKTLTKSGVCVAACSQPSTQLFCVHCAEQYDAQTSMRRCAPRRYGLADRGEGTIAFDQ
jgi:hypothetical protein